MISFLSRIIFLISVAYCPDARVGVNLSDTRDSVVLTSTQCCVIPVEKGKKTEFTLQLFNYQSYDENPAVLVILVSKNGTSAQIIEKSNQKLYFNDKGTSRYFDVERLQDARERRGESKTRVSSFNEMKHEEKLENVIMMIQVPLVVKTNPVRQEGLSVCNFRTRGTGMDMGQIGLGSSAGSFVGIKGIELVHDNRFPIRCTYQYYRVTDENFIGESDITDIATQFSQVSSVSLASGSLVVGDKTARKTEPDLDNPKNTDSPFGKLDQDKTWGLQAMSIF